MGQVSSWETSTYIAALQLEPERILFASQINVVGVLPPRVFVVFVGRPCSVRATSHTAIRKISYVYIRSPDVYVFRVSDTATRKTKVPDMPHRLHLIWMHVVMFACRVCAINGGGGARPTQPGLNVH